MGVLYFVSVVCCQVEVSATGSSPVQRSPTERVVSECDREASILKPWPTGDCCAMEKDTTFLDCDGLLPTTVTEYTDRTHCDQVYARSQASLLHI
jgi:hypothetical protein